jgi:hypothetical protein
MSVDLGDSLIRMRGQKDSLKKLLIAPKQAGALVLPNREAAFQGAGLPFGKAVKRAT